MATVINPRHSHPLLVARTGVQKICVALGIIFIILGLTGVLQPSILGLHLSEAHNLIHLASGSLCLWSGFAEDKHKAYLLSCVLGIFYAFVGIIGFLIGKAGYPAVGYQASDSRLWRVIPDVLEFGTNDHTLHLFVGFFFLLGAFFWKMKVDSVARSIVDVQRRK